MQAAEPRLIDDLIAFARIEIASGDLEPWAAILGGLHAEGTIDAEAALWLVKLYNAYDDLGSAWSVYRRWGSPARWARATDWRAAAEYPCTQERRNLRGGRVLQHLEDYAAQLDGGSQARWLRQPLRGDRPESDWQRLVAWMRTVWGVGRQTGFEWAEFVAKVARVPVTAPDAMLWESEGPRRSLQRLYGNARPTAGWLDRAAVTCRQTLREAGVDLVWEDFETVICDFNVMRDGRYYPGRHLAALRAEIEGMDTQDRAAVLEVWHRVIPAPWASIAPTGIDKAKMPVYRDTGQLVTAP